MRCEVWEKNARMKLVTLNKSAACIEKPRSFDEALSKSARRFCSRMNTHVPMFDGFQKYFLKIENERKDSFDI